MLRDRVARSMLTTLYCSLGTPMITAGDEFGRTQQGNNNAYCQDNAISWIDWSLLASPSGQGLSDFVRRLAAVRRHYPLIRASHFLHGEVEVMPGIKDIDWYDERGEHMSEPDWQNGEARALVMRRARRRESGLLEVINMLMNGSQNPLTFRLPPPHGLQRRLIIDSAVPDCPEEEVGDEIVVQDRAVVIVVGTGSLS
jgi:glycogen operon protein